MTGFRYLLDTNIVSALIRDPQGAVADRVRKAGEATVCTSIVVACELRYGAEKKGAAALSAQLESVLAVLPVLPLQGGVDRAYGNLRTSLERRGRLIGPNDLLIASQVLTLGLILVTDNIREFSRVPELKTDNWLRS